MLLRELVLKNIRSHQESRFSFSDGITLLAGDIGSGKTTLLMAIEFALFGLQGEVSAAALLRHGEEKGSVTLTFDLGSRITVHRVLRRGSSRIEQKEGYLEIDGERVALSATELKARIISLIGYPESFVGKKKGSVYQYTVYTPQEEMKKILFDNEKERLDTLRGVFGIDKYKLIGENASVLLRSFKKASNLLEGELVDLPRLEEEVQEIRLSLGDQEEQLVISSNELSLVNKRLSSIEDTVSSLEEEYREEERRIVQSEAQKKRILDIEEEITTLKERIVAQQQIAPPEPVTNPEKVINELLKHIQDNDAKRVEANTNIVSLQKQIDELTNKKNDITRLDECPTCQQEVSEDHKEHIEEHYNKEIESKQQLLAVHQRTKTTATNNLDKLEEKKHTLESLRKKYQQSLQAAARYEEAKKNLDTTKNTLTKKEEEIQSLRDEQDKTKKSFFNKEKYEKQKTLLREQREVQREAQNKVTTIQTTIKKDEEIINKREETIKEKKEKQALLKQQNEFTYWLEQALIPVNKLIEKHVLASIHKEFNNKFTQWFSELTADEGLYAELSPEFTPIITQDGYEQTTNYLSGGEKQSVALAYRLALNAVINEYIETIKTSDLLILDEPTDGFSAEQLDRVRDVLEQLSTKQVILVSHEQQMEGFVDRVIRIEKREGVSQAL